MWTEVSFNFKLLEKFLRLLLLIDMIADFVLMLESTKSSVLNIHVYSKIESLILAGLLGHIAVALLICQG